MMEYIVNYKELASWKVFSTMEEISVEFFNLLVNRITEARIQRKNFSIALSGGSTPDKIYKYLSIALRDSPLSDEILIFWGDERCVPPTDPESNFGNVQNALFSKIMFPLENIHRIRGEDDPEKEARRYADTLQKKLPVENGFPVFDMVLLGVGDDGHTASIFPGQMDLLDSEKWVQPALHPASHQKRITLTGNVLMNAKEILILAAGEKKQKVVDEIFHDLEPAKNYPAWHIRPTSGKLMWFLDKNASADLK